MADQSIKIASDLYKRLKEIKRKNGVSMKFLLSLSIEHLEARYGEKPVKR
jgi:hypothetical protein